MIVHAFQLLIWEDCDYPKEIAYYVAAHALFFLVLFAQFYVREYVMGGSRKKATSSKVYTQGAMQLDLHPLFI